MYSQRYDSIEYVQAIVDAKQEGSFYDPTGDSVVYQFVPEGTEVLDPAGWHPGLWETDNTGPTPVFKALCMAGPGQVFAPLQNRKYWLFLKITDNPEVPVLGPMTIKFT